MKTIGDVLDCMLGGPAVYVSHHCKAGAPAFTRDRPHGWCLGFYGGRSCECWCHMDDGKGRGELSES